jgi:sec-independent protein translocase protein TatB
MFGMGFMEIMIIAIIAVLFLGPDKLPETMVNIAKFFRSIKSTVADAKDSLEQEINISELKKEALSYKEELMSASDEIHKVKSMADIDTHVDNFKNSITQNTTSSSPAYQEESIAQKPADYEEEKEVTFKKKTKKQTEVAKADQPSHDEPDATKNAAGEDA